MTKSHAWISWESPEYKGEIEKIKLCNSPSDKLNNIKCQKKNCFIYSKKSRVCENHLVDTIELLNCDTIELLIWETIVMQITQSSKTSKKSKRYKEVQSSSSIMTILHQLQYILKSLTDRNLLKMHQRIFFSVFNFPL